MKVHQTCKRIAGRVAVAIAMVAVWGCGGHPLSSTNNNNNTAGTCGDDRVDSGEVCDGSDLDGNDCTSLGEGFTGGTLACGSDCEGFDTDGCVTLVDCGNSTLDPNETCDGTDLGGLDCVDLGFDEGDLACRADCSGLDTSDCRVGGICGNSLVDVGEQCDGTNLDGADCTTLGLGFSGGTLACGPACLFDTSACTTDPDCGNGAIDPGEVCDGVNLAANDCTTLGLGFTGGILACTAGCAAFDTSGCVTELCGDGNVDAGELCDTANLDGNDCTTIGMGFTGGTLACVPTCDAWNTTACTSPTCGDNNIDTGELCDSANLGGADCTTIGQGYVGGTLACNGTCDGWDTSACVGGCPATNLGVWNGTPQVHTINTCAGSQDYSPIWGGGSCTGFNADGSELIYALTLAGGESVVVTYDPATGADGSLYVLDDCLDTDASGCVAGSDEIGDGVQETVLLTNSGVAPQTYYIVADNFSGCGTSILSITAPPGCGNNVQDPPELCDGGDLGGETCQSIGGGFTGGSLACNGTCDGWDTSACTGPVCGDGVREGGEQCDGADVGWQDCTTIGMGFVGGTLLCNGTCDGWNTAGCVTAQCGDGAAQGGEVCDGGDLRGESCQTIGQGFTGGTLACNGTCDDWNTAGCTFTCTETDLGTWTGAPISQSGSTCTGTQSYSPPGGSGCTGWNANGFEVIYGLTLPPLASVDIVYGATTDNALYVITDCADTTAQTCVVGADENYGAPFSETVTLTNAANAPTHFYIVLDNWTAGACSAYTLNITP